MTQPFIPPTTEFEIRAASRRHIDKLFDELNITGSVGPATYSRYYLVATLTTRALLRDIYNIHGAESISTEDLPDFDPLKLTENFQ